MRDWLSDYKFQYDPQGIVIIAILFYVTDIMFSILPSCLFNKEWKLKNCIKEYDYISFIIVFVILVILPHIAGIDVVSMIPTQVLTYMSYVEDFLNIFGSFRWSYYRWYKMNGCIMTNCIGIFTYNAGHLLVKYITNDMNSWYISKGSITKKLVQSILLQLLVGLHSSDLVLELAYFSLQLFNLACKVMGRKDVYQYINQYIK